MDPFIAGAFIIALLVAFSLYGAGPEDHWDLNPEDFCDSRQSLVGEGYSLEQAMYIMEYSSEYWGEAYPYKAELEELQAEVGEVDSYSGYIVKNPTTTGE